MTSKEAVNLFKQYNWSVKDKNKALEILEELAESDTPLKVIKTVTWDYLCPKCENEIYVDHIDSSCKATIRYCDNCGQKLEWSGII